MRERGGWHPDLVCFMLPPAAKLAAIDLEDGVSPVW
jgi:hypothetical protein